MNKIDVPISDAIRRLVPDDTYNWSVVNDLDLSTLTWDNEEVTRPTDGEIDAMRQTIADEITAEEYKDWRVNGKYEIQQDENGENVKVKVSEGYPPVEDYLDAIVKGDEAQKQAYIDACLAVKAKYPKPE